MEPSKDMLGFIGIGVMGSSMAGHLLKGRVPGEGPFAQQGKGTSLAGSRSRMGR